MARLHALSVVIPAFNEAHRLPATLTSVIAYVGGREDLLPAEVIVVDDGSSDGTAGAAGRVGGGVGVTVRVIGLPSNRGKGAALREGLMASRGAKVLLCDADLAAPIEELAVLLASNAAVIAGSRALRRDLISRRQPLPRDLLGRLFNLYLRILRLTDLEDTQCGFKLLDGELARCLAPLLRLDRFAFDVELLARARRMGASIAEVPVRWRHVEQSRVDPLRDGLRMGWDALRLRIWLWLGR
jgi:dolichyl-phosphate beta-glucosyltransferase